MALPHMEDDFLNQFNVQWAFQRSIFFGLWPGGIFQSQVLPLHLLHPIPEDRDLGDLVH